MPNLLTSCTAGMGVQSFPASRRIARTLGKCVLGLLAAAGVCERAYSQAAPTAIGPDKSVQLGGGVSFFQQDYGKRQVAGGLLYVDVRPHWRYGLEGEARFLRAANIAYVSQSTYLGGLKIILSPRPSTIQPYVKLLAGAAHITLPYQYASGTFAAYAPGAGVDVKLGDYMRLRLIDVEYQQWRDFPYGTLSPYGVSAGLSIRLNRLERFPKHAFYTRKE
ncbi:MAG: hypothetical protein ACRYGF_18665 [Janthinobacterium lividum]